MAFELRNMTFQGADPLGRAGTVSFFAGYGADAQQSKLWIAGQLVSDGPSMRSLALNQLTALHRARDLLDAEIARLTPLYHQAEQAQH
jgi:hypothetical protein